MAINYIVGDKVFISTGEGQPIPAYLTAIIERQNGVFMYECGYWKDGDYCQANFYDFQISKEVK